MVKQPNERFFAVIENNKVINIVVGVDQDVLDANPDKYIEYTDGWDFNNGIDGGIFFRKPLEKPKEVSTPTE